MSIQKVHPLQALQINFVKSSSFASGVNLANAELLQRNANRLLITVN